MGGEVLAAKVCAREAAESLGSRLLAINRRLTRSKQWLAYELSVTPCISLARAQTAAPAWIVPPSSHMCCARTTMLMVTTDRLRAIVAKERMLFAASRTPTIHAGQSNSPTSGGRPIRVDDRRTAAEMILNIALHYRGV